MKKSISFLQIIFFFFVIVNSLYAQDFKPWGQYWHEMTDSEKVHYLNGLRQSQIMTIMEMENEILSSYAEKCVESTECFNEMKKMFKDFQGKLYWQFDQSAFVDIIKITDDLYRDKRNNFITPPSMIRFSINRYKGHNIDKNLEVYRYRILNPDVPYKEYPEKLKFKKD